MAETTTDLKDEETVEDESASEETPSPESELLENTEETPEAKAEKLLRDGTSPKKEITVSKDKFDDRNEKAKLYETHAPLLEKVLKNPDLVEELLETKTKGDLEARLERLEEERKAAKRQELREAVTDALSKWSSFDKDWPEIRDDVDRLVKRGLSYKEAVRRNYLALHPEEAQAEAERIARENANALGNFSSSSGMRSPQVSKIGKKYNLLDTEKRIAKALGKSEEEYGKLLETHADWLKTHGFDTPLD